MTCQSFEFESWFDREFPMDPPPSRPKYQKTSVTNLMRAAWDARDAEIAALRERIAGMEKDADGPAITADMHADAERWRYAYKHLIIGTQDTRNGFEEVYIEAIDAAIAKESGNDQP